MESFVRIVGPDDDSTARSRMPFMLWNLPLPLDDGSCPCIAMGGSVATIAQLARASHRSDGEPRMAVVHDRGADYGARAPGGAAAP